MLIAIVCGFATAANIAKGSYTMAVLWTLLGGFHITHTVLTERELQRSLDECARIIMANGYDPITGKFNSVG